MLRHVVVLAFAFAFAPAVAVADLRHEDYLGVRPDLKSMTASYLAVKTREVRTYNASGQVTQIVMTAKGKLVGNTSYKWNAAGHLIKRTFRSPREREEINLSYKLDASGRIIERTERNPKLPAGEFERTIVTWQPDGSRFERTGRYYPKEGPYFDQSVEYDAQGRVDTECSRNSCQMHERDARGNIRRTRDQMGDEHAYRETALEYDAQGRLVGRGSGDWKRTFTYNAKGDVIEEVRQSSPRERTVFTYVYR